MTVAPLSVVAIAWCLSLTSLAQAQQAPAPSAPPATSVPRVVRLDGAFVPADGLPPAAVETVTLSLFASEVGGTPLWEETQQVRVDPQGRYAVFLGATTPDGLPVNVLATGEPRWLGLRFVRAGETEQARVPLTSVPYALRASDADTLGGLPPAAFLRADPAAREAGGGDPLTSPARSQPGPLANSGTANFIGKFTNSVDLGNSVLFENAGQIGLGTTTPLDLLHTRFTNTIGTLTGIAVQNLGSTATSYSGMLFYDQNGALGQFQGFNNATHEYRINNIAAGGTINFMLGGTSRFQVRNDGDVSISGNVRKSGSLILHNRSTGNIAVGLNTLAGATPSPDNTAVGEDAMAAMTDGSGRNVALGRLALTANTAGAGNTALGYAALRDGQGGFNIGIGPFAGFEKVTGDFNIALGYAVGSGVANTEDATIRIGDSGFYSRFFAGGVRGVTTGVANAVTVMIDSNGQLGTVNSSRRYKEDIQDMGDASSGLMQLRPVTYRYAQAFANGEKPIDYGLIAEEVEEVYPDLVAHLANGEVETVQYHKINAMLLNEVQKQHRKIGAQQTEIEAQQRELEDLKARLAALERLLTTDRK